MEQSPKQHFSSAVDHAQEYLEIQKEIVRLHVAKHSGAVAGYLAALILVVLFFMVFYILGNIAVVFFINKQLHDLSYAFLIVALANIVLVCVLIVARKMVIRPVQERIIRLITE